MSPQEFIQLVARLDTTEEAPLTDDDIVMTLDNLIYTARRIMRVESEVAA